MPAQLPPADELWLAAHDTVNGKARLARAELAVGLGTALLAELMFWGCLTIHRGRLHVRDSTEPDDVALHPIITQFMNEEAAAQRSSGATTAGEFNGRSRGQDVRQWIAYLAADDRAFDLVVNRLSRAGLVERHERRTLGGRRVSYIPRDPNLAGWPASRIGTAIRRRESLDDGDLTVAGLFLATGLHQKALFQLDSGDFQELSTQLRTRMHDMLRELIHHAETAIGEMVMTR